MDWQECSITAWYDEKLDSVAVPVLVKRGYTGMKASYSGFLFAVLAPLGFFAGAFWGFLVLLLSAFFYSVARRLGKGSGSETVEDFISVLLQRTSHFLYLLGFWVYFYMQGRWIVEATVCIILAIILVALSDFVSDTIEFRDLNDTSGVLDAPARVIFFLGWSLLLFVIFGAAEGLLWVGMIIFIAMMGLTLIQKLAFLLRRI
ncbi:MAG: hypothetical protein ACQES5_06385 [Thermodesulfobacteriota bacterium]